MNALLAIASFLIGVYLSIRIIAALYRIIDLWYTIESAWPRVVRGILGWSGAAVVAALILQRAAFLSGAATSIVLCAGLYAIIWRILVPRMITRNVARPDVARPFYDLM
jgi:branched-subunit amino acid transport protein